MYNVDEGDIVLVRVQDKFDMTTVTSGRVMNIDDTGERITISLADDHPYLDKTEVTAHKEDVYENTQENRDKYFD